MNLLGVCALSRHYLPPLFHAAFGDSVLRTQTFSSSDQALLHHVNVALAVDRPPEVPLLPRDVAARCESAWLVEHRSAAALHDPLAASLRRLGLPFRLDADTGVGYRVWLACVEPGSGMPFAVDVDTRCNHVVDPSQPGERSASLARRLFLRSLETAWGPAFSLVDVDVAAAVMAVHSTRDLDAMVASVHAMGVECLVEQARERGAAGEGVARG